MIYISLYLHYNKRARNILKGGTSPLMSLCICVCVCQDDCTFIITCILCLDSKGPLWQVVTQTVQQRKLWGVTCGARQESVAFN